MDEVFLHLLNFKKRIGNISFNFLINREVAIPWTGIKKSIYLSTFFLITPLTILVSIMLINLLAKEKNKSISLAQTNELIQTTNYGAQVFSALPKQTGEIYGVATVSDARTEIIRQYLEKYNSPLESKAQFLVDTAQKYELDFRLLVAIAQQESNLCKKIPDGTYNCWGWGIHSRGTLGFNSFEEGIETVAQGLKSEYIDKGYLTPEQIMSKYTPSSPGSWAKGVSQFLAEME